MRFDIIDLRLFLNVYKAGSITGGAMLSNLTLQSASERIRGMEGELGVQLFSRSRKGVRLSDAGYSLVNHANIVLQQIDHMHSELQQYGKGLRGHINLLCNSSAQNEFLPEVIGPFLLSRPNISVAVKEMLSYDIVAAVKNQMASLGIVADSTQLNGLDSLPFRDDELVVFAPANGRWLNMENTTFEDIVETEFIGLSEESALQKHIEEHAKNLGHRLNYRVRMTTCDAVMQVVSSGVGIAIIPKHAAERCQNFNDSKIIRLTDFWADRKLIICARDFTDLPGYVKEFVDFLVRFPIDYTLSKNGHIGT
ncbi:LysR substrate-binding domain-containing protein [Aeromonas sobria]|uniref:LysR substrate-binding domain-containing protein n=1 Tax=Aeromonas sobria TaxID=646 RepID=UPI000C6ED631|nr:LysR substrate-binding domain-containing protein [Aeromonas sobria]PKQ71387.1 LysR family transcriptional regulator [Aeromonas sobria]